MKLRQLKPIQKDNVLNTVYSVGETGPGGAYHQYVVTKAGANIISNDDTFSFNPDDELLIVKFQKGPRKDESSIHGVLEGDLLEIVRDRLIKFQEGKFACEENEEALNHVISALEYMKRRADNRARRGVLGTTEK